VSNNTNIMIVDDDEHMLELLSIHVEGAGYTTIKAKDGLAAMQIIEAYEHRLSAIVSDVEMPQMNGYELCSKVRSLEELKEIPFIFVSAKTSLEEKLKGYDVGGDEYITKPLEGDEVLVKIKHIIENRVRHQTLTRQLQDSHNAAMQAMSYTGYLGQVLQFLKSTEDVSTFAALAEKLFEVSSALGLTTAIQFHTPNEILNFKKEAEVTPLEANVIELARSKGRIFDFQSRTIFNYKEFSLLILNMPVADNEKYGMLKDVLGNLCDTIESKAKLLASNALVKQKEEVITTVTHALQTIEQTYRDIQQANMEVIDNMIHRMEEAMLGFGLSESQEDTVRGIVLYVKNKMSEVYEDGAELFDEFEKIRNTLQQGLK